MEHSPPTSGEPDLPFDILADSRRRHLLDVLREQDRTERIFLDTLSDRLCEREDGTEESADEIAVTLHHHHLPRLEEAGLVTYDPYVKMVEFRDLADDRSVTSVDIAIGDD